jgi:hypothetical protein
MITSMSHIRHTEKDSRTGVNGSDVFDCLEAQILLYGGLPPLQASERQETAPTLELGSSVSLHRPRNLFLRVVCGSRIKHIDDSLRHAFEFAHFPFDKNAEPFGAVIRCTSGGDVDNKTISKWSRALRYVARSKEPDIGLRTFMKEVGGINACADNYAKLRRSG